MSAQEKSSIPAGQNISTSRQQIEWQNVPAADTDASQRKEEEALAPHALQNI